MSNFLPVGTVAQSPNGSVAFFHFGSLRRGCLALGLLLIFVLPAWAGTNRTVEINTPATAVAGSGFAVVITASTTADDGEQVGFLQAEYSADGGKTWTGMCYDTAAGSSATRTNQVQAGAAGTNVQIRVRVAFRGPKGDVDLKGKPIDWNGSWEKWQSPPAISAKTSVVRR
jgi:hypothetical protein